MVKKAGFLQRDDHYALPRSSLEDVKKVEEKDKEEANKTKWT